MSFASTLLYLYIFVISWTGVFALGRWFPLHVVLLLTAFGIYLPKLLTEKKFPKHLYHFEDILPYLGIVLIIISALLHPNKKSANYLLAYFYIFGLGYYALKFLLYKKTSIDKLYDINTIAVLVTAAYAVVEVVSEKYFGFDIQSFLPRFRHATAMYNENIPRAYGFATEPGILAYYLNCLGPLAVWRLWNYKFLSNTVKLPLTLLVVSGLICTFSPAGIVFMMVSVLMVLTAGIFSLAADRRKRLFVNRCFSGSSYAPIMSGTPQKSSRSTGWNRPVCQLLILIAIISFLVFLNTRHSQPLKDIARPLYTKASFQTSPSAADRLSRWKTALSGITERPFFGYGIGNLSSRQQGSSTNWYLFLSLESGIFATAFFVFFLLFSVWRIFRSTLSNKYWFLVGLCAAMMHFMIISTIQHAFIWVLLALFHVANCREKPAIVMSAQEHHH